MLLKIEFSFIFLFFVKFSNQIPVNEGKFFEGDISGIDLKKTHKSLMLSNGYLSSDLKTLGQLDNTGRRKWPFGIVPYTIDSNSNYSASDIKAINDGFRLVEDKLRNENGINCITFVPRTTEQNYLRIFSGSGCYSNVGKNMEAGKQDLSLMKRGTGGSCMYDYIVAHELLHALGFWHEQSRPDRDLYVTIQYENIDPNQAYNFDKHRTNIDLLGLPYDIGSIMHYAAKDFSINGKDTIVAKEPGTVFGVTKTLSDLDVEAVRKYYKCL